MDLNERLIQVRKDKAAVEAEEKKILEEINKPKKLKFGDVVEGNFGVRVMLYDSSGELVAFDRDGHEVGGNSPHFYKTLKNMFKDNLLDLDN